jgi:glycosyltransferase involved in cell wall biosynthesis
VVADETGLLVPARDAPALAKAMRAMLDATPAERASMGARARRRVTERFDQSQVIRFYLRAADAATHMTPCASVATGRTGG